MCQITEPILLVLVLLLLFIIEMMARVSVLLYCGLIATRNQHSMSSEECIYECVCIKGGEMKSTVQNINQPFAARKAIYHEMSMKGKRSMVKMVDRLHLHHGKLAHNAKCLNILSRMEQLRAFLFSFFFLASEFLSPIGGNDFENIFD